MLFTVVEWSGKRLADGREAQSVVRRIRPGLHVTEISVRPEFGTKDIWIGSSKAYVKIQDADSPRLVVHELMAARLANGLGVPVPFGEVAHLDGERLAWAVAHIGHDGEAFAPPDMTELLVSSPHILAGISVFDTWIHNTDRTDENLIWHDSVGLWAIDHEEAFSGNSSDPVTVLSGCRGSTTRLHAMDGLSVDSESVLPWLVAVRSQGRKLSRRVCDEAWARGLLTKAESDAYHRFLSVRSDNIGALVTAGLELPVDPLAALATKASRRDVGQPVDLFESSGEK